MIEAKSDGVANEYFDYFGLNSRETRILDEISKYKRFGSFYKSIKNSDFALFYRLTNNIISKCLHFLRFYFSVSENNIGKQIPEGVSDAVKIARTQMAQAKQTSRLFGAVAGAAMTAAAVLAPFTASAQDASPTSQVGLTHQEELRQLDAADRAATEYARDHNGIGILIHVGQDIPNQHFATADAFGAKMVEIFNKRYGVEAEYFLRQNDAPATVITYHIDTFIHGADNGTEVKDVKEALAAMPEAVEYLKIAKQDQVAQIDPVTFDPNN